MKLKKKCIIELKDFLILWIPRVCPAWQQPLQALR